MVGCGLEATRLDGLSINLTTLRQAETLGEAIDACLRHGITSVGAVRDQIRSEGLDEATAMLKGNGIRVTSLCRGGPFPAADVATRAAAIDESKRAIDDAARLNARCLIVMAGSLPPASKDIGAARTMVAEGLAAILPHARACGIPLAIEPLHPMLAADRACVNTLEQALDMCEELGDGVGVAIDVYHTWWDPKLLDQIGRAGAGDRILCHHISDWLVPTRDLLVDRGMMGDGIINLDGIRTAIEAAGYGGPQEVEIFSAANWWKRPVDEVLKVCVERYLRPAAAVENSAN